MTATHTTMSLATANPFAGNNVFIYNPAAAPKIISNPYDAAKNYANNLLKYANLYTKKLNTPSIFNYNKSTNKPYYSHGLSLLGENQNASLWSSLGYDSKKGTELAQNAVSNAVGFTGYCARYVKNAIAETNLGNYESGNACDMIGIMRRNSNFKEISPEGVDLNKLPAGCVLVYDRGVSGYSSKYGHTEITTGTGKGVSDGITNNLRKPSAIFMPVTA